MLTIQLFLGFKFPVKFYRLIHSFCFAEPCINYSSAKDPNFVLVSSKNVFEQIMILRDLHNMKCWIISRLFFQSYLIKTYLIMDSLCNWMYICNKRLTIRKILSSFLQTMVCLLSKYDYPESETPAISMVWYEGINISAFVKAQVSNSSRYLFNFNVEHIAIIPLSLLFCQQKRIFMLCDNITSICT